MNINIFSRTYPLTRILLLCIWLAAPIITYSSATAAPLPILLLAAENFPSPTKPTPPTPPSKVILMPKDKQAETKPPEKIPIINQRIPQENTTKPRDTAPIAKENTPKNPAPSSDTAAPTKKHTDNIRLTSPAEITDETVNDPIKTIKTAPEKDQFFNKFIQNSIYSILILTALAFLAYLYWTTPKSNKPKYRQMLKAPSSSTQKLNNLTQKLPLNALPDFMTFADQKVKNKSLLEQLIKYDMETYGELRSNLDYEQPAYVESLIRKYGKGSPDQINHAVHLFYTHRSQK